MDRPSDSEQPEATPERRYDMKTTYLLAYNVTSSFLWTFILGRLLYTLASTLSPAAVFPAMGNTVRDFQTYAALEITHSMLGLVRAPLFTTIMQVTSRFFLVWGILFYFPQLATAQRGWGGARAYAGMVLAWSVTEVVRYVFFALSLWNAPDGKDVPRWLKWARYNLFFVLYPVGITCECVLLWLAAQGPAKVMSLGGFRLSWALYGVLAVYVPGSYILFTHMMAQRRRVMGAHAERKTQ